MTVEQQKETSPKFKEIDRVSKQVKEELKRFNKEKFYEKDGEEIKYNMDTVKQYLGVLKDKKTWKELISKNSSAMVMAVQIALYSQNYSFGTIDGILGEKTKAAIRKFQADNNLPVDTLGRSMPSTIEKLLEVISREDQVEIPKEEKQEAEEIMKEKEKSDKETKNDKDESKKENDGDEKLDQNSIRPEIKERAKHPLHYSNKFEELIEITYAEAKAIHWDEERQQEIGYSYLLPLSGVREVTPETFEELLKHKGVLKIGIETLTPGLAQEIVERETETNIGENITFSGLKTLNLEVCEILGDTKGILTFDVLESLSADEIGRLIRNSGQRMYFNAVREIDSKVAEKIADSPREIYLDGVTNIDLETAQKLSKKKVGTVHLTGLKTPLSNEILDELIKIPTKNLVLKTYNEITPIYKQVNEYRELKEKSENNN